MKLNIQLFADDNTVLYGDQLNTIANDITTTVQDITELLKAISDDVLSLSSEGAYNSESGDKLKEVFEKLKTYFATYADNASSFGTYLKQVVEKYGTTDSAISKEISAWAETVQAAITTISGGLNSTVEKGSYSVGSYFTDMSASTRTIVSETAKMIGKTGDFYKSVTGQTAMGTIKTLFAWGKSALSSTIGKYTSAITA